jgi:HD superfamily phosphohydrolase YqeK
VCIRFTKYWYYHFTSINEIDMKMIEIFGLDIHLVYKDGNEMRAILHDYADTSEEKKIFHFIPEKELTLA